MSNWNGKVKCVSAYSGFFQKGQVFTIKNGKFIGNDGHCWSTYRSLKELNENLSSTFEEISIPQPHKSLLKSGMKVVYRSGVERYVFLPAGVLMSENGKVGNKLSYYSDDMLVKSNTFNSPNSQDIMEIYSEDGELIAKREEKSTKDTKIEELEKRMRELADEIAELKDGK